VVFVSIFESACHRKKMSALRSRRLYPLNFMHMRTFTRNTRFNLGEDSYGNLCFSYGRIVDSPSASISNAPLYSSVIPSFIHSFLCSSILLYFQRYPRRIVSILACVFGYILSCIARAFSPDTSVNSIIYFLLLSLPDLPLHPSVHLLLHSQLHPSLRPLPRSPSHPPIYLLGNRETIA
jgi:hypothetical protein